MRVECDIRDLEVVSGEVPRDLNGNFYRATHDPLFPPFLGDDIYVNGDGMISYFHFENGHVDFKSRYVRTDRYKAQMAAGRSVFGVYRNRYTNDPSVEGVDSGTANTTPVWHGRKLLALKEDSHPWELDPHTLETRGKWDYDGDLKAISMTAHPKLDYRTGELVFFAYQAKGDATTDVVAYTADKDGHITHEVWFNAPYPGLVHDFAVTEEHIIFPFFPLITDLDVLKAGRAFLPVGRHAGELLRDPAAQRDGERHQMVPRSDQFRRPYDECLHRRLEGVPGSLPVRQKLLPLLSQ